MIVSIKKIFKNTACKTIIVIFFVLCAIAYSIYKSYFDMSHLPRGEYLSSLDSPNGNYTLNAYLYDGCGATCAFTLRVELVDNITKKVKNIYWQYRESEANMKWIDDDNVEINGTKLNIKKNQFCKYCKGSMMIIFKLTG